MNTNALKKFAQEARIKLITQVASKLEYVLTSDSSELVNYNKFGTAIKKVTGLNDAKAKEKVRKFDWIDTTMIK